MQCNKTFVVKLNWKLSTCIVTKLLVKRGTELEVVYLQCNKTCVAKHGTELEVVYLQCNKTCVAKHGTELE